MSDEHGRSGVTVDEAILRIGQIIASDSKATAVEWDAIALVVNMANGREAMHGYRFQGEDWQAFLPEGTFDIIDQMAEVRLAMTDSEGRTWHQALIQLEKAKSEEVKLNVTFEHDDPERWSVGSTSLDLEGHALSLRPGSQ